MIHWAIKSTVYKICTQLIFPLWSVTVKSGPDITCELVNPMLTGKCWMVRFNSSPSLLLNINNYSFQNSGWVLWPFLFTITSGLWVQRHRIKEGNRSKKMIEESLCRNTDNNKRPHVLRYICLEDIHNLQRKTVFIYYLSILLKHCDYKSL